MRALIVTLLFALAGSLAACAESGSEQSDSLLTANSPSADAGAVLAQQAQREASARNLKPISVPPPPGVESSALKRRGDDHETASLALDRVVRRLAEQYEATIEERERPDWLDQPVLDADQAVQHYVRGRDAVARQQYDEAMRELLLAHNFDARSTTVARELARVYATVRNRAAAAEMYEHLLLIEPKDAEAKLGLALHAVDRRDFEQAALLIASARRSGQSFDFDPAGEAIANATLLNALNELGYDRAVSELGEPTIHLLESHPTDGRLITQFGILYRQRGELWQRIGDARARLGEFRSALAAYEQAASLPTADAWSLLPRRVYALIQLGRVAGAQHLMYEHLAASLPNDVDVRDVNLCSYVAEHVPERAMLAEAVLQLHLTHPDKPALVRCAAALVERGRAIQLLQAFVTNRAGDFGVLQQFLDWLAREDVEAAADLVCTIAQRHPHHLEDYAAALLRAAGNPTPLLEVLERGEPSAIRSCVLARCNERLGAIGEAWTVTQRATERWPNDELVARLALHLAAELKEPALLDEALAATEHLTDAETWAARAEAHRAIGDLRQAHRAASEAVTIDTNNIEALLELARTQTAVALAQPVQNQARLHAWDAAQTAQHILSLEPTEERAYEILLFLFGSEGPLTNTDTVEEHTTHLAAANPASPLLTRLSLEAALRQMRYDRAIELALELYAFKPTEAGALSLAISAWSAKDDLDAANAWLEAQRRDRAQDPVLLEAWTRIKVLRSETSLAQRELTRILNESPRHFRAMQLLEAIYRTTGDLDRALELGEARLRTRPQGVQRELALASMFAEAGRDAKAVEALEWVANNGSEASLDQLTAAIQLTIGIESPPGMRDIFSRTLVDRIVLDHPELALGSYLAGLQALHSLDERDEGRTQALLDCLAQRAETDSSPNEFSTLYWQAVAQQLVDMQLIKGASAVLRARLRSESELDPSNATMLALCAILADAAGGATPEETIALIERTFGEGRVDIAQVLNNDVAISDIVMEAANAYTLLGDDAGAETLLRKVIALDPSNAMALNNLGYARVNHGQGDNETIKMIERAIQLSPDDPNILDTIGWLRYKQGHFEDTMEPRDAAAEPAEGEEAANRPRRAIMRPGAVSLIRDAINASPEPSAEVHDHLGDALWRIGDKDAALREWKRARDLLTSETRKQQRLREYAYVQQNVWRLQVAEPLELWNRDFAEMRDHVERKIEAAEAGQEPDVAPLFDDVNTEEDR